MAAGPKDTQNDRLTQALAEGRAHRQTYRERALKLFPWVCARCTREFPLRKLHELTVHHKDHDHDNNPPDGSNWELLCNYCHENEHGRLTDAKHYGEEEPSADRAEASLKHNPFAALAGLGPKKKD